MATCGGGGSGLGLRRAAERFRRIKRHGDLGALVTALGAVTALEPSPLR
jgi:hypothetical protein